VTLEEKIAAWLIVDIVLVSTLLISFITSYFEFEEEGDEPVASMPNRAKEVNTLCKAHPEAFPQNENNDSARLAFLKGTIIPELNKLDGGHWGYMTNGIKQLVDLPVWLYDESAPSLSDVVRIARKWKHQHGIKALYVDYLQRISATGDRRQEEVSKVARGLKNLARALGIPVIALAQVNRASEQMADKRPTMASLSDSSEIEKEADQIILIYREGYYTPEAPQDVVELIIAKNRHGATGRTKARWSPEYMRFSDLGDGR